LCLGLSDGILGSGANYHHFGGGGEVGGKSMVASDLARIESEFVVIDGADDDRQTVLVVEDDESYQDALQAGLTREAYQVEVAPTGVEALRRFGENLPDLVLLDVLLPDVSGIEVCRRMISLAPVPIIMVSALGAEEDIVNGLEFGALDYVTKPYRLRELVARMHSVLRRSALSRHPAFATREVGQRPRLQTLVAGPVCVDLSSRVVTVRGRAVYLSRREFDLLALLLSPPGLVRTRSELVDSLWFGSDLSDTRTLDTHIRRLRVKLERDPASPRLLVTVRGVGFRFEPEESD
jgi:two-component system, OmpR family, response regulator RegX3